MSQESTARHSFQDLESYVREVMRLAQKMRPEKRSFCLDTVNRNYEHGTPAGLAAKAVVDDTSFWEPGSKEFECLLA
jgi:hypothetical protein